MRKTAIAGAQALDPAGLSDEQKFERDYLIRVMQGELFWLEEADRPHHNPDFYVGVLDPIGKNLEPGPKLYGSLMRQLAQTMSQCFRGS